ncbi:MAG: glutamate-1-semialdehyde 2,1-aminomutase [Bradymonadia bacterium]
MPASRSYTESANLLNRAEGLMPGGVNSPVRAFRAVGGRPPFIASAEGCRITDVDGNEYIDYVGTWGPAILGHSHPKVVDAICEAARKGTSFGAPTAREVDMAERIRDFFPGMEMLRLVNSGTEATMSALRVARGATGRNIVIKFEGCYHGHADSFLVKAGSGLATFGEPDSAGVPSALAELTLTLPFNDHEALAQAFADKGDQIACVALELVTGNMGVIEPTEAFRKALVEIPRQHGAALLIDEVMTGFRVSRGGAQGLYGIEPDLTCLGKIVGGGMPLAVYGGKAEFMRHVSPLGAVYQAGTLSGNPVATAAGMATLSLLDDPGLYPRLEKTSAELCAGLEQVFGEANVPVSVQRVGSMFTVFFTEQPVMNFSDVSAADHARFGRFHRAMLDAGIYLPPSGYEACFVSAVHGEAEIEATLAAAREAVKAL